MKELIKKDWEYILYENEERRLILSVVVGTVLMTNMKIALNEIETEHFTRDGVRYVDEFAKNIQTFPDTYAHRLLK